MHTLRFQALGTEWGIDVYSEIFSQADQQAVLDFVSGFEDRFSRFKPESEVNAFRTAAAGTYPISEELARILTRAAELRRLTMGRFDPTVAELLERAGYDRAYRFDPEADAFPFQAPGWEVAGKSLSIDGPLAFDLGGIGKGYCIDRVAGILLAQGHRHILVEAGGDMFGTEKPDGHPFCIALEWPGRPDTAIGTVSLRYQGLAASDTFRRRWKKWHHIIDPVAGKSADTLSGCAAIASNAWEADCMTAALFQLSPERFSEAEAMLEAPYAAFLSSGEIRISPDWPGELFE